MPNAFDFHADVAGEESAKKEEDKKKKEKKEAAEAKSSGVMGASGGGGKAGFGSSSEGDKNKEKEEREKRQEEQVKLSQMSKMERIIMKKEQVCESWAIFRGLYLCSIVIIFPIDCCITKPWSSSIKANNNTSIANNRHTDIYPQIYYTIIRRRRLKRNDKQTIPNLEHLPWKLYVTSAKKQPGAYVLSAVRRSWSH